MVIDKNRILIGFFIILFFISGYFLNLDFLILFILITFLILELHKCNFLYSSFDYIIILFLLFLSIFFYSQFEIIKYYNIAFIILVLINIFSPNFYLKRIFVICILIFIYNFFFILMSDRNLFYLIIFVAFFNDTIAYIFGKTFKGPLILPSISPKKTWSGTSISFILTLFLLYTLNFSILNSCVLALSLFFGDIFFSYIKRKNNLKDFSNLLQGHGGILDRLDSMFFFVIIIYFL